MTSPTPANLVKGVTPIVLATMVCLIGSCRVPRRPLPPVGEPPALLPEGEVSGQDLEPVLRYPNQTLKVLRQIKRLPDGRYVLHGAYTSYYPSGRKKQQGRFKDGQKHGTFITWDEKGTKICQRHFVDDLEHGTYRAWDGAGRLIWEVRYSRGRPHGRYTSYHPNGHRRGEGTCVSGKRHGLYLLWDEAGTLIRTVRYADGREESGG